MRPCVGAGVEWRPGGSAHTPALGGVEDGARLSADLHTARGCKPLEIAEEEIHLLIGGTLKLDDREAAVPATDHFAGLDEAQVAAAVAQVPFALLLVDVDRHEGAALVLMGGGEDKWG